MLFNSFQFFIFFPIVTGIFFLLPHKFRWFWLLAASCYFYMAFIPVYITILGLTIVVDYWAGIAIENSTGKKRKAYLLFSIITTCLILFVFKYFNFFNSSFETLAKAIGWNYPINALNIILPIGLSFHTFQSLSYVIEVYRGNQKAERHFGIYSLYVMFYPQLVAGPIERPQNLLWQFHKKHSLEYENVRKGLFLMLWGLFKKIVIADRLSLYVNEVYNNPSAYHGWPVIVATLFFTIQIYCDFSGYSDVAIGSAKVMGFDLMTNFNRPYISRTISEFWRRWHISLSTWFKDYVYFPMGGNRVVKWRWYYNLFITFMISGLWHGANWTFIIWGALHGFYLVFAAATLSWRKSFSHKTGLIRFPTLHLWCEQLITFSLVCLGWVFFRANNVQDAFHLIGSAFEPSSLSSIKLKNIQIIELGISFALILFLFLAEKSMRQRESFDAAVFELPKPMRWATYLSLACAIAIIGYFGDVDFIYFQF